MIFVSTMTYAMGKEIGFPEACAEFLRQLADPDTESLPCVRTIARLRSYDAVGIWHDASATCLGKSRSRAFHAALEAFAGAGAGPDDVYITVDDDVEADSHTLGLVLEAVRGERNVLIAPCITRGSNVVNVALEPNAAERTTRSGARLVRARSGGFGLVAMSYETMLAMVAAYPDLHFLDDDNTKPGVPQVRKTALFFDLLEPVGDGSAEQSWTGEDVAFCVRAHRAGIALEALCTGFTVHAGQGLKLECVTELQTIPERPKGPAGPAAA